MTKEELEKENEVLKKENRYLEYRNDLLRIELELRYRDLSEINKKLETLEQNNDRI